MTSLLLLVVLAGPMARAEDMDAADPMEQPSSIAVTSWNASERAVLSRGEPVARHWRDSSGRARGLSAVVVSAPAEVVWKQIVDIDAWVEFLPYVTQSYTSLWEEEAEYTHILAGYQLTTMGVNTRYKVDNRWYADQGVMVFQVTPEGSGPISGGDGWWRVSPWPGARGQVLLEYSVDMSMQWWVPSMIERKAADRLPTVVRLIGRRAEKAK